MGGEYLHCNVVFPQSATFFINKFNKIPTQNQRIPHDSILIKLISFFFAELKNIHK